MSKLRALVAEVDAALDIYLAGRTGQQFNKTAFILSDDLCELASKLFLMQCDSHWTDARPGQRPSFKSFRMITEEVLAIRDDLADLVDRIRHRRERRNGFFHSAHLLDLTLHARDVNDALLDMVEYSRGLFGDAWDREVASTGNLETAVILLQLDCLSYGDPLIARKTSVIFANRKRAEKQRPKGCEVTYHPEDHHLRLAIRNGGKELRDQLAALLLE